MKAALSKLRKRIRIACLSIGGVLMLLGDATLSNIHFNLGAGIVVWFAQETFRIESNWRASSWRGHSYAVAYKHQGRTGTMLEVGGSLLAITGAAIAITPFCFPRRRIRTGVCPLCSYDRQGLGANAPCPECGGVPNDVPPTSPSTVSNILRPPEAKSVP
jgi:hypothetical protein